MHFVSYGLFFLWSVYDFVYRFIDYSHITDIRLFIYVYFSKFKYSHNNMQKFITWLLGVLGGVLFIPY